MNDSETLDESLEDLQDSLQHAIHILQGILDDIEENGYNQEQARLDYENLVCNEGIDYMTALESFALFHAEK
jgi:hypothetical protein